MIRRRANAEVAASQRAPPVDLEIHAGRVPRAEVEEERFDERRRAGLRIAPDQLAELVIDGIGRVAASVEIEALLVRRLEAQARDRVLDIDFVPVRRDREV